MFEMFIFIFEIMIVNKRRLTDLRHNHRQMLNYWFEIKYISVLKLINYFNSFLYIYLFLDASFTQYSHKTMG